MATDRYIKYLVHSRYSKRMSFLFELSSFLFPFPYFFLIFITPWKSNKLESILEASSILSSSLTNCQLTTVVFEWFRDTCRNTYGHLSREAPGREPLILNLLLASQGPALWVLPSPPTPMPWLGWFWPETPSFCLRDLPGSWATWGGSFWDRKNLEAIWLMEMVLYIPTSWKEAERHT